MSGVSLGGKEARSPSSFPTVARMMATILI
jgi:hypothetical protein